MSFLLYRVNGSKATHGSHTKNRQRIFVLFVTIFNPCFVYMYSFRREKPEHDQGIRGNGRMTLWWAGASGPEIAGGHALGYIIIEWHGNDRVTLWWAGATGRE
jgi:hypothetical protein